MRNIFFAGLFVLVITGCTSTGIVKSVDKSASRTLTITKTQASDQSVAALKLNEDENNKKLESRLLEVLDYCKPLLSGYEKDSAQQAKNAYWLSMSGLVAGSVFAPALIAASASNGASVAALSGWAGATNYAGQALKTSGLSGATIANTRNDIINGLKVEIVNATDGSKSFEDRRSALMRANAGCVLYEISVPAIPDQN
jgi:hypothetical protein